jgi:hypothetical protein
VLKLRSGSGVVVTRVHLFLLFAALALAEEPGEHGGEERLEARRPRLLFPAGKRSHRVHAAIYLSGERKTILSGGQSTAIQLVLWGGRGDGTTKGSRGYNERRAGALVGRRGVERVSFQRSGSVRIATVGGGGLDGWDRSAEGALAVEAVRVGESLSWIAFLGLGSYWP